jgi:hypothetical protein
MPWDLDKAIQHLTKNAGGASQGRCAEYTRQAIEAGGVTLVRQTHAKDYGTSLLAAGFQELQAAPVTYDRGDVVVIESFDSNPAGHMAMYDGSQWISDFRQRELYPGPSYRAKQPGYAIYRYPAGQMIRNACQKCTTALIMCSDCSGAGKKFNIMCARCGGTGYRCPMHGAEHRVK